MSGAYDPGPQISHAASINLGTLDLERSLWFFRDVLGMEEVERDGRVAYLRAYQELAHHSLVLTEQAEAIVNGYGLRTKRPQDVELFAEELQRLGVETVEVPAGAERGRGTAVRFLLPGGEHPFELFYEMSRPRVEEASRSRLPSNSSRRRGLGVRRLDHFNLQTAPDSINEAEQWLQDHLGFRRREFARLPDRPDTLMASWLSVTPQVHDLAIVANREDRVAQLHHLAYNVENLSDVLTAADILRDLDIAYGVGPGKHGVGQAMYLYVHDPGSDHRIEIYAGGYLIFDPDWEPIEWPAEHFADGLTWYGAQIDNTPGSRGRQTTGSAPLHIPVNPSIAP
jgi:catechol 2,3-dioxygenase